jgi:DNA-binding NarL/FixJ family response regulator
MIKVLVADDHVLVRRGIVQVLAEAPDICVAAEAGNGTEALQAVRKGDYDVVVLDISMPDMNGLEVLKQVRTLRPDVPVLILSMYSEEQYALRALRAGAVGYLTKDSLPGELIAAIREAVQGGRYVSRSLAQRLAGEYGRHAAQAPHETLSDREFQVMGLLAAGRTVSEIAVEMSLNVKTVSTYRARMLVKLGLRTTADIVRYAVQHSLVP